MESAETRLPEEDSLRCPICGNHTVAGNCPQCQRQKIYPLVRREIWLLVLVAAASIPLYLFTREAAIDNRDRKTRAAAYWFERGQEQLRAGNKGESSADDSQDAIRQQVDRLREFIGGNADGPVTSFHRATMNDRENFEYGLALANALAVGGHPEEAQIELLRLRDSAPEHSGINLQLARLAASSGDLNVALHYYRNAFYGVWQNGSATQQRRVARMELIHFLLGRNERNIALSELLLLSVELPEDSDAYAEVARLMFAAGDPQQALERFDRAIQLDDKNASARAGAGTAAFRLQDYRGAIPYLQAALALDEGLEESQELLEISRFILSRDPTAPRLSQQQRGRRLIANFDSVFAKLEGCLEGEVGNDMAARLGLEVLRSEALTLKPRLLLRTLQREPELQDVAMDLIYRTLQAGGRSCGAPSTLHQALLIIGRSYRGGEA